MPPTSSSTLRLVLEARALGLPMVLTLNMSDMAVREGIVIDRGLLSRELAMPVLETVGVRHDGAQELLAFLDLADPRRYPAIWPPPRRRHPGMRRTWRR
jgi:ferrous iron transport protein B